MWHIFIIVVYIFVFKFFSLHEYVLKKLHVFFGNIVKIFFFKCVFSIIICVHIMQQCVNNEKNCVK